jgi:trbC/VIRB2 family
MRKVKDLFSKLMMMVAFSPIFMYANDGAAEGKVKEIGKVIVNILITIALIYFTIMFIVRGMKIAQGEMSARELIPPVAGGVICFLAYFLANLLVGSIEASF